MKIKRIICFLIIFVLTLCGCNNPVDVLPTNMTITSSEIDVIVNSKRDLYDIVTLKFEPRETTNKEVSWSCIETDIITLTGSKIKANKSGKANVTATSIANTNLSVNVTINVYDPNIKSYNVFTLENEDYVINGLQEMYLQDSEVSFSISLLNEEKTIKEVKANEDVLVANEEFFYSFIMPEEDVTICVTLEDVVSIQTGTISSYNIKYDLGTRKTSKAIETTDELLASFEYANVGSDIINSISQMEYIYGGAYGGSGDSRWVIGDVIKFGTTSVNGSMTFSLNSAVNCIKITGYVSDAACKIRVGDAMSLDWTENETDNKTTIVTCSNMNETTKEIVEANQTSTITIEFASTNNLRIAVTNSKPFYIASIEFIVNESK